MKKISSLLLVLVALFLFASCDKKPEEEPNGNEEEQTGLVFDQELKAEYADLLKGKKLYLTTCGQADIVLFEVYLENAGLEKTDYTVNNLLAASDVTAGSAVIMVIGASGKGLGDAGTNVTAEIARAEAFGARQTAGEIILVVVHIGGEARTGAQSDPIIQAAVPVAKLALVVDTKTKNDVFTNAVGTSDVDLLFFSRAAKLIEPLKYLLGKE